MFFPFKDFKKIRIDGSGGGQTLQYITTSICFVTYIPDGDFAGDKDTNNSHIYVKDYWSSSFHFYIFRSPADGGDERFLTPIQLEAGHEIWGQNNAGGYLYVYENFE